MLRFCRIESQRETGLAATARGQLVVAPPNAGGAGGYALVQTDRDDSLPGALPSKADLLVPGTEVFSRFFSNIFLSKFWGGPALA